MFNLIVAGGTRDNRRDSMTVGRVFEYTEDYLTARYMPNGRMDIPAVMGMPTLFMEEGLSSEVARIGWLSRIEIIGQDYQFHYMFDPDIPALTNSEVYDMASELKMHDWEFSRNHWAIKDADLTYVLLKYRSQNRPRPAVFQLSENPVDPNLVSLMMPFSGDFSPVHRAIKTAIEVDGYACRRADDFWLHAHIMHDVVELICTSGVVICDLSGKNPNVFYEAGIAHTLGKEVILITQSMDDVPFDLRALRCISYLNNNEGCAQLAAEITDRLRTIASR